jgi:serine/threonine protein kinase
MAVAALDHTYICKLFEIGEDGDALFLVMEYIAGTTLHQRLIEGRMPLPDALRLAGEIAEALQEAHAGGFLHRDLKPSNVMLTPQGHVKGRWTWLAKRVEVLPAPTAPLAKGREANSRSKAPSSARRTTCRRSR